MLSKETIEKIALFLKIKATDLTAAIADSAEVAVILNDNLNSFTEDEITQVKNNEYKSGEANIWNNKHYEVFGGPQVGRLAYVQILVELN